MPPNRGLKIDSIKTPYSDENETLLVSYFTSNGEPILNLIYKSGFNALSRTNSVKILCLDCLQVKQLSEKSIMLKVLTLDKVQTNDYKPRNQNYYKCQPVGDSQIIKSIQKKQQECNAVFRAPSENTILYIIGHLSKTLFCVLSCKESSPSGKNNAYTKLMHQNPMQFLSFLSLPGKF